MLYCQPSFGQNKNTVTNSTLEYDNWNYGITYSIEAGIWQPLGNLNNTFKTNPNIGLKFGFPISKPFRIELGTSVNIPINSEPFLYTTNDTSFNAHSINTVNGILGLWVSHEKRIKKNVFIDKYFGLGLGLIQTGEENIKDNNYYTIETINFNLGVKLRRIIFKKRSIGIFMDYNFAPFSLFKKVNDNFGNSYLTSGISYRF